MIFRSILLFGTSIVSGVGVKGGSTARRRIGTMTHLTHYSRFVTQLPGNCSALVNRGKRSLSKNRHRHVSVTHTLLGSTPIVLLSRTATDLSMRGRALVRTNVSRLVGGGAIIVVTRHVHAITGTRRVIILGSKAITRRKTPSRLLTQGNRFTHVMTQRGRAKVWVRSVEVGCGRGKRVGESVTMMTVLIIKFTTAAYTRANERVTRGMGSHPSNSAHQSRVIVALVGGHKTIHRHGLVSCSVSINGRGGSHGDVVFFRCPNSMGKANFLA